MAFYLPPPFGEVTPYDAGPIACAVLLLCFMYGLIGQCLGLSDPSAPTQHPWFMSVEAKAIRAEAKARQLEISRNKAEKQRQKKAAKRRKELEAARKKKMLAKGAAPIGSPRKPSRPPGHGGRTSPPPPDERSGRGRGKGGKGGRGREGGGGRGRGRGRGGDSSPGPAAPSAISARNELAALE